MHPRAPLMITCSKGASVYLAQEIQTLGYTSLGQTPAGVKTEGTMEDAMRLNVCLRTGHHVLYELASFACTSPQQLYQNVHAIPWEQFIEPSGYVCVTSHVTNPSIRNWQFANLKTKDALVDRITSCTGTRPDSGNQTTRTVVFVYWKDDFCTVYLDTSGVSLAKRAYRRIPMDAPLQETLAATLLLAAGYTGAQSIVNPACGAGTLAIEAALIAMKKPPGILRDNFGFMHIKGFDRAQWNAVRAGALAQVKPQPPCPIIATDIKPEAVHATLVNARLAGVERYIETSACSYEHTKLPESPGIIFLNPPYGERLDDEEKLFPLYTGIGNWFKQRCPGWTGFIFSGNTRLLKRVGLKPSRKLELYNGAIPCRLNEYPLY